MTPGGSDGERMVFMGGQGSRQICTIFVQSVGKKGTLETQNRIDSSKPELKTRKFR